MKIGFGLIGRDEDNPSPPSADDIHEQQVRSARSNNHWTELDPADLIERGHFLVSATDDSVYTRYAGAVWNALGGIAHSETNPLYFTVEDGNVCVFERYPETWSAIIARQTRATVGRR